MNPRRYKETAVRGAETGVILTQELIDEFITSIQAKGYVKGTVDRYQTSLEQLYDSLSGEKRIGRGTLAACRKQMLEDGYAVRTANLRISAANSLLGYLGLREYQLTDQIKPEDENLPEITRSEYLQLLRTARNLGRERVYLLVKLFASTGLPLQELSKVTVESVTEGKLTAISCGTEQEIRFPDFLQEELLAYAKKNGYLHGPIFLTRDGKPMSRTNVTTGMRQLCEAAGLLEEKGNPRCLKRLYQVTREEISNNVAKLIEQEQIRLLEQEQEVIGWMDESSVRKRA
ncbi:MAG: hypothetical protein HFE43_07800 [Oscillospiraceae bacterium]|nr:hypothetical protein [Oscillospiraceae bacterium]